MSTSLVWYPGWGTIRREFWKVWRPSVPPHQKPGEVPPAVDPSVAGIGVIHADCEWWWGLALGIEKILTQGGFQIAGRGAIGTGALVAALLTDGHSVRQLELLIESAVCEYHGSRRDLRGQLPHLDGPRLTEVVTDRLAHRLRSPLEDAPASRLWLGHYPHPTAQHLHDGTANWRETIRDAALRESSSHGDSGVIGASYPQRCTLARAMLHSGIREVVSPLVCMRTGLAQICVWHGNGHSTFHGLTRLKEARSMFGWTLFSNVVRLGESLGHAITPHLIESDNDLSTSAVGRDPDGTGPAG